MGHDKVKAKHLRQGQSSSVNSPSKGRGAGRLSICKADLASIPLSSDLPCAQPRPSWDAHPLFLAGHKSLEAWGHAEPQLVDVGRLLLAVDLHPDPCLE